MVGVEQYFCRTASDLCLGGALSEVGVLHQPSEWKMEFDRGLVWCRQDSTTGIECDLERSGDSSDVHRRCSGDPWYAQIHRVPVAGIALCGAVLILVSAVGEHVTSLGALTPSRRSCLLLRGTMSVWASLAIEPVFTRLRLVSCSAGAPVALSVPPYSSGDLLCPKSLPSAAT